MGVVLAAGCAAVTDHLAGGWPASPGPGGSGPGRRGAAVTALAAVSVAAGLVCGRTAALGPGGVAALSVLAQALALSRNGGRRQA